VPEHADESKDNKERFNKQADVVHEYNIVKTMLINNSLPVSQGGNILSRKLIIDKKIILNLLIDL
jgi:hypothetical protein